MPTVAEIQAQQQALKVMEAQNSLPHITAALAALQGAEVTALSTLCAESAPLVADPQVVKTLNSVANILTMSQGLLTRMRDAAAALVPVEEPEAA